MSPRLMTLRQGLAALLFAFPLLGFAPPATATADDPSPTASIEQVDAHQVIGRGILAKLACIACLAGLLSVAGFTVGGILITALAYPEVTALCGLGCAVAFG